MRHTALILLATYAASASAADWLQFGSDEAHSSYNNAENGYSTATGNTLVHHYGLPTAVALSSLTTQRSSTEAPSSVSESGSGNRPIDHVTDASVAVAVTVTVRSVADADTGSGFETQSHTGTFTAICCAFGPKSMCGNGIGSLAIASCAIN